MTFLNYFAKLMNKFQTIVMIGSPASGKTHIARELAKEYPDFTVIHTDEYIEKYGFKEGLYRLLEDILALPKETKLLIEGVMGCRLLRKGVETNSFYPDCVVEIHTSPETVAKICFERGKDYTKIVALEKGSQTILTEYRDILASAYMKDNSIKLPLFVGFHNEH